MKSLATLLLCIALTACVTSGPATSPNETEWSALLADYSTLESLRRSAPAVASDAPRRQQIEVLLATHEKLEPMYEPLMDRLREYYERTGDSRAAQLYAREKVVMGDQYMNVLARYDRAIGMYEAALALDPQNAQAAEALRRAREMRYIRLEPF